MAYEETRWATDDISQIIELADGSTVTVNNKEIPTDQLRDSGWLYQQGVARAHLQYLLNQIGIALADIDQRLTNGGL